ncbi:MAG: bifunctional 2-C-methyl-D-erythritol 4-phosphate cytidylyltransferase/2-C-methyl-D-erythritol 2,4-cyclodiphosphate synthase [Pseudomonadota bacterium]
MSAAITDAIVLAAGRGTRLGAQTPKQFLAVGGKSVVARAIDAFLRNERVRRVVVAIGEEDEDVFSAAIGPRAGRLTSVVGGDTRQASVAAALEALSGDPPRKVLIHDGARPFLSQAIIGRVIDALDAHAAVIPGVPVADTLKRVEAGAVCETVDRSGLFQAQTPQGFLFGPLKDAHALSTQALTDDAGVMEAAGHAVVVVAGERGNFKITTQDDLAAAERAVTGMTTVGQGFDVHRLVPGGPLILCGLTLDEDMRLAGHSDADVALHAITDALLGAIGDGDIGAHFPPSDAQWAGAASDRFLRDATERVRRVGEVMHLDLTIICERPKIGPLRDAMRRRIAEICDLDHRRVSLKATTTERLGFTGRGEGIAAQALATVRRFADPEAAP